jgi:hypothetical protein
MWKEYSLKQTFPRVTLLTGQLAAVFQADSYSCWTAPESPPVNTAFEVL